MPEETVDIFACAGILGNDPVEPHVLGRRIQDVDRAIVIQIAESIISAFYFRLTRTVDPEGIVVDTHPESFRLAFCHKILSDTIEMRRPPVYELPELPVVEDIHTYKAPLYWSIYEYCYTQEQAGVSNSDMDFTPEQWDEVIDWVARELKPYGYDMVCTDGFIPMEAKDASGYMTHYGSRSLKARALPTM